MLGETGKAGEIQRVERPSSQEEKNGAATVVQNQYRKGWSKWDLTEYFFSVVRNDMHKRCGLDRVKNKNLILNELVGCLPRVKKGCSS
jgi:hypothetical protein